MTQKIHEYHGNANTILSVMKWLRQNGAEPGKSFTIHYANYRVVAIEFFDNKLELMYIMKYDWGKSTPS